jgi:hypothetical protein
LYLVEVDVDPVSGAEGITSQMWFCKYSCTPLSTAQPVPMLLFHFSMGPVKRVFCKCGRTAALLLSNRCCLGISENKESSMELREFVLEKRLHGFATAEQPAVPCALGRTARRFL